MVTFALFVLSAAVSAGLLAWSRRLWFLTRSGTPWWRASALTGAENLRVGAAAAAMVATLAAAVGMVTTNAWYDRVGPLRSTRGVVVGRDADGAVVAVSWNKGKPHAKRVDADAVVAPTGAAVSLDLGRGGVVTDDEAPVWNFWSGSCLLLLAVALVSVVRSTQGRARRRLIAYRI